MVKVLFLVYAAHRKIQYGWNVTLNSEGQDTFTGSVLSPVGTLRPALDQEIFLGIDFGALYSTHAFAMGAVTIQVPLGQDIPVGMRLRIYRRSIPMSYMSGVVQSYAGYQLSLNVDVIEGDDGQVHDDLSAAHILFGGEIEEPLEKLYGDSLTTIETQITGRAFNLWRQNVHVNGVIFQGTVKHAMQILVDLFNFYGYDVTLASDQIDGPIITDMTLPLIRFDDVITQIEGYSGYRVTIDANKIMKAAPPIGFPAPFNVENGNGSYFGNPTISRSRSAPGADYANQVYVVWAGTPETARDIDIISNSVGNPTVIKAKENHYLFAGATVTIKDNVGSVPSINGTD
jgi:hypothetical protein